MDQQVIDYLNSKRDASEAVRITEYTVFFGGREVLVSVRDRGPGTGGTRYAVYADWARKVPEDGVGTTHSLGSAAATLDAALDNVPWWKFDPDNA